MELLKGTVTPKDWATTGGIAAFTVVLCLAFYFLIHGPQLDDLAKAEADNTAALSQLAEAKRIQEKIGDLRADAAKMNELVTRFEKRLPESKEIPTLLKQFEGFAGEIGLRVQLSQQTPLTEGKKQTIPYKVVANGNFHQIVSFINRLERFERYLKVSDLSIGKEEDGVAEASFTLSTFLFTETEERPKS